MGVVDSPVPKQWRPGFLPRFILEECSLSFQEKTPHHLRSTVHAEPFCVLSITYTFAVDNRNYCFRLYETSNTLLLLLSVS